LLVLQRLLIFLGILTLLTFVAALFAPPNLTVPVTSTVAPPKPKPPPAKPKPLTPEAFLPAQLSDAPGARFKTIKARVGETVQLTVTGPASDVAAIDALGLTQPVAPDLQAPFVFYADQPGTFTVSLLGAQRNLGAVMVQR
jgi:heme/copper-type cytochrome/quinol oxidase subunit 2